MHNMLTMKKIIRITTLSQSLGFFEGILPQLTNKYEVQLISSRGEKLVQMGEKYGVKTHTVEMYRRISPMKDLKSLFLLCKIFYREKPFVVHSMTPKAGFLCMIAAWITRVPVRIHTFTGLIFPTSTGMKRQILMLTDRITCACATHINPEGYGVLYDLKINNITRKPMRVLGYGNVKGVDMAYFNISDAVLSEAKEIKEKYSLRGFTFIFVGRICKDKGVEELVAAFKKIQKEHECNLILVGPYEKGLDPLSPIIEREIETNSNIHAVGPQSDVRPWYAAADCLAFPSYREGFPNVVLEAGAMGLPSVVTNINGSREIIENGKNGLVVSPRNVYELCMALCKMIEEPLFRLTIASNARPMIESRFEKEFVQQCLLDWYDELIKETDV